MESVRVFMALARALPLLLLLLVVASSMASAAIVERTFHVQNLTVDMLCERRVITAVNGCFPGPSLDVREGDTVVVNVVNESPYDITVHWHGIFQKLTVWADGPNMITQCPIKPGKNYVYKFTVTGQEGTLWWHAHFSSLRATVYGALVIRPRPGHPYPFPKPDKEVPILLGEWWNANVVDLFDSAVASGIPPRNSDAYTINGLPGDTYNCSKHKMYKLKVVKGKRYLLRIINAAMSSHLFFKIANHRFTVVAVDASYTNPYNTDVIVIAPGQTVDAILCADQSIGSYYMAAQPYSSNLAIPFANTTTRGVVHYAGKSTVRPIMPKMPAFGDTPTAHRFYSNLTGLAGGPHWVPVARHVDEHMFVTVGLGQEPCKDNSTCPNGPKFAASMNNHSFVNPNGLSILQAAFYKVNGVFTEDFPDQPPIKFDYTDPNITQLEPSLVFTPKKTSVKILRFNSTVEMVMQNTALVGVEDHPMHLHGFNFHVLALGFGNFNPTRDRPRFNLRNPQIRNTIAVPVGGWAVIRFTADNPGAWIMHCHIDIHLAVGLATVFVVENGPTWSTMLPPPPPDLPQC